MKRLILAAVIMMLACTASFAKRIIAEGPTYSVLGNYTIELADNPFLLKGQECKAYVISYQNTPMKVTIAVCKEKNCRKYVVVSEKLSVQYVCNQNYFGVERLDRSFESEGLSTSDKELNRFEYYHQKVITPGKRGEVEAAQLIAAYFPFLLNQPEAPVAMK